MKRLSLAAGFASAFAAAVLLTFTASVPHVSAQNATTDVCCKCNAPAESQTRCLTIPATDLGGSDCSRLPSIIGNTLKGWTCTDNFGAPNQGKCRAVAANGLCQKGVIRASAAGTQVDVGAPVAAARTEETDTALIPILNTPIPRFSFTSGDPANTSSLLAQYIAGAYGWLIAISAIVATIMFVWGAFRYLLGSSGMFSAQKGKEIMQESVIGMMLVLGAYMILQTVNPDTLTLNALYIQGVKPERALITIPENVYSRAYGGPAPKRAETIALAKKKAEETGIPELPCIVYASLMHESGGRMDVIGHDENFQSTIYRVSARQTLLKSGKKYSGATFPVVDCTDPSCQSASVVNDDNAFDPLKPPDYGLDWRFSHGFGASQSTIFPNSQPCQGKESEGRGFRIGSTCYTIPALMSAEGNLSAMIEHFKLAFQKSGKDPARTFVAYAGNVAVDNPAILSRMRVYERCRSQ